MIVNPQYFNYKLIISSLIVTIAVLGIFGFSNYETFKAEQQFLQDEKKLVESELSQMLRRYDSLSKNRTLISAELNRAKALFKESEEELRLLKSNFLVAKNYKSRVSKNQSKTDALFKTMNSIYQLNTQQALEKEEIDQKLEEQRQLNDHLKERNNLLGTMLEKGSEITAHSISAKAFTFEKELIQTTKAALTTQIDISFTLAGNTLAVKGLKDIYIQILNPLNNVIGQKKAIEFGDALLIYSAKQVVNYTTEKIEFSTQILAQPNDIPFSKGTYYVSLFLKDRKLGDTQFVLN